MSRLAQGGSRMQKAWNRTMVAVAVLAIGLSAIPSTASDARHDGGHDRNQAAALQAGSSRITGLEISRTESPTFEGQSFGDVGPYRKIVGRLHGVLDPSDPRNSTITDLDKAGRNALGLVEYTADFYLLTPVDPQGGNHAILAEVANRGNKLMIGAFNRARSTADPTSAADAGDGFLFEQGFTLLWVGWQGDLNPAAGRVRIDVPIATDHGRAITGVVRAEFLTTEATQTLPLSSGSFTGTTHQSYASVTLENVGATLTRRVNEGDARQRIPNDQWSFASCPKGQPLSPSVTDICFPSGFQPGLLYELIYTARDPRVLGIGFAALRDAIIFFRNNLVDDAGTRNPLAVEDESPEVSVAVLFGISQSGRAVRTFEQLGFNSDATGRPVFEGIWAHIGPGRNPLDVRFGQPGRAYGQHEDHLFPAYEFPFTYGPTDDPLTGRSGSVLDRCRAANNCPKVFHTISAMEFWQGKQSLDQTDPLGITDQPIPENVRMYFIASTQHGPAAVPARGICQQLSNPAPQAETMRALLVALREWLEDGDQPPPSQIPTIGQGTLVPPDRTGFPSIPGVRYTGLINSAPVLDFGAGFSGQDEQGVISQEPPQVRGAYRVLAPRTDADGNDVAGIRSTTIQAPLGTYTGWNLRRRGFAEGELCGLTGSFVPFAGTPQERTSLGDPRLSLAERYGSHDGYVAAVRQAGASLVEERFLLAADAERLAQEAEASPVLR